MMDYIIIGLVLIAVFFGAKRIHKNSKDGGCAGCSGCSSKNKSHCSK